MTRVVVRNSDAQALGFKTYYNTVTEKFEAKKGDVELTAVTEDELMSLMRAHVNNCEECKRKRVQEKKP